MFRISGFRAAVGNSNPELKEMSDYVAKASYGPGFAEIIDYMHDEGLI
jgi:hydroxymethylpyrimidine pyrophosphatase-like HAD family hydrolase